MSIYVKDLINYYNQGLICCLYGVTITINKMCQKHDKIVCKKPGVRDDAVFHVTDTQQEKNLARYRAYIFSGRWKHSDWRLCACAIYVKSSVWCSLILLWWLLWREQRYVAYWWFVLSRLRRNVYNAQENVRATTYEHQNHFYIAGMQAKNYLPVDMAMRILMMARGAFAPLA